MSADERLDPSFYRHWIEDRVRFADLDPLGHCNNAAIGGFFEAPRVGARVLRFGRTSFTLAGAVFDNEHCAATAQVVAVLFDLGRRRSVELTDDLRQALEAYA